MPKVAPGTLISGYTSDGTNITIPISALTGLTSAEADASTGDSMEVLRSLLNTYYSAYLALDTANRPSNTTLSKSSSTGTVTNSVVEAFTIRATSTYDPANLTLVPES